MKGFGCFFFKKKIFALSDLLAFSVLCILASLERTALKMYSAYQGTNTALYTTYTPARRNRLSFT